MWKCSDVGCGVMKDISKFENFQQLTKMPEPAFMFNLEQCWKEKLLHTIKPPETLPKSKCPSNVTMFEKLQKNHDTKQQKKQKEATKLNEVGLYPCLNCNSEFTYEYQLETHIAEKCKKIIDPFVNSINEFLAKYHESSLQSIEGNESVLSNEAKYKTITNHKFNHDSPFYKSMKICIEYLKSKNANFSLKNLRPEMDKLYVCVCFFLRENFIFTESNKQHH